MAEQLPWFPLWVPDFLTSRKVRTMTPEQVGVYILLLCNQWEDGPLPDDDEELETLANGAESNAVRTVLERCFEHVENGWLNQRLEEVREEQNQKRLKQVRAGKASAKARRDKKKERRSNGVPTALQRKSNQSESEVKPPVGPPAKQKRKRATQLPDDWTPNDGHKAKAKTEGVSLHREEEKFRNFHLSKASTYIDWDRAFTTWLLKAAEYGGGRAQTKGGAADWVHDLPGHA